MMRFLITLSRKLDQLVGFVGRQVSWLVFALVIVMFAIVVLRYVFDLGWIAMQESTVYLHAIIFLLGIAYTLQQEEHVRVDIFYHKMSKKTQAWVDLLGSIMLLLPVSLFILWVSHDYISTSFVMREASQEAGGLAWVYFLKAMIDVMAGLLVLQGLSNVIKIIAFLMGDLDDYQVNKEA